MTPNPAWDLLEIATTPVDPGTSRTIVFAGHVTPNKGVRELVLACRDIKDVQFRLELVGPVEEDFRVELRAAASVKNDGEWLNIQGQVKGEEALARIASGFALALPSYTEGFPNVLLEAMMLGKPVVATPVGAMGEILADGGIAPCGICVPVGDVGALKNAIESLLRKPDYARELGRRGKERVAREYSPQAVYQQYKAIWET